MRQRLLFLFLVIFPILPQTHASAQSNCQVAVKTVQGPIYFSLEQEDWLGDVIARDMRTKLKVIENDDLVQPLRKIMDRLLTVAPVERPKYEVFLIDSPEANAFTIPGGKIFVTKKLISTAKSEDEVAGVLAHEMGHSLTRQMARDESDVWRSALHVTNIGTRADLEDQYFRLYDILALNPDAFRRKHDVEEEQREADRVSIALAVRTGYSGAAFTEFFDRVVENRGKTGNWFTDVFGGTAGNSRRYRELLKENNQVPPECVPPKVQAVANFEQWRKAAASYSGFGKTENLPSSAQKKLLQDPIRSEISHLRFSSDGKYVLAQDAASIYVLTREPFASLFRIDATDAETAEFTPDSKSVVFYTEGDRMERWDIESQQQTEAHDLHVARPCFQDLLSPTGEYLACVQLGEDGKTPLQLGVLDIQTGKSILRKEGVVDTYLYRYLFRFLRYRLQLEFSPDGRYLVGRGMNGIFAFDLKLKQTMDLPDAMRKYLEQDFVFATGDTLIGEAGNRGLKSALVKFPSGEVIIGDIPIGPLSVFRAAKGEYAILRPVIHAAAGIMNLRDKKIFLASKTRALDIYDGISVGERANGELGLYRPPAMSPFATALLPKGPVTNFNALAVSAGGEFVAYSARTRGAVWETKSGTRLIHLRGFNGAYFSSANQLFAVFPPLDSYASRGAITKDEAKQFSKDDYRQEEANKVGHSTAAFDPKTGRMAELGTIQKRYWVSEHGSYLLKSAYRDEEGKPLKERILEVSDITTGKELWTRKFKRSYLPAMYYNLPGNTLMFDWEIGWMQPQEGKDLIKETPGLKSQVDAISKKSGSVVVEVLDHRTGEQKFAFAIDTGERSFQISDLDVVGDTVLLRDSHNRLILCDKTGKVLGRIFGTRGVLDTSGKMLAAETEPGRVVVFTLPSLQPVQTYTFGGPIASISISSDSKHLIVITVDQTFYSFSLR